MIGAWNRPRYKDLKELDSDDSNHNQKRTGGPCFWKAARWDAPPVSLWYHFGVQHGGGEQFARTSLDYFHYYDFDFLKVMNDYLYPPPEGTPTVKTARDLAALERIDDLTTTPWAEQFKAIAMIADALKDKAYCIDTVFDAWQSINRNLAAENMPRLMEEEPEALLSALERVNENLIDYCRKVISLGAAGIFLTIPAGAEILSREAFNTFVKPFTRRLLEAVAPLGPMTTLHVHGRELFFEDVIDLPAPIFNWWDRGAPGTWLVVGQGAYRRLRHGWHRSDHRGPPHPCLSKKPYPRGPPTRGRTTLSAGQRVFHRHLDLSGRHRNHCSYGPYDPITADAI